MKTGYKENFGKGFQVPAGSHSFESGLKKTPLIEVHPFELHQNPIGGVTVLHQRGSLKTGTAQKISKRYSVLVIPARQGIFGSTIKQNKNANPLSQAPPVREKFAVVARIFPG